MREMKASSIAPTLSARLSPSAAPREAASMMLTGGGSSVSSSVPSAPSAGAAAFRRGGRRGATMDARDELLRRARAADAPADGAEGTEEDTDEPPPVNIIDAASRGAADGLSLALNVGAMLLAFISLIALANVVLGAVGGLIGNADLTVQEVLGYVFAPVMTAV